MFNNKFRIGVLQHPGYHKGKGGGGGSAQPTQSTNYTTNIPEYAKPYVENMLNATQAQIYDPTLTTFNKYTPYSTDPTKYVAGFSPLQQYAQSGAANLNMPANYGLATGQTLGAGMQMGALAPQMGMAGANYANQATNPYATQAYMNPYLSASLAPQLEEARRQYDVGGQQQQSNAARSGAFGGSREALMAAENRRNMNQQMNQMIGQGYNNAFGQAQQAQQFGANLGLQGQQAQQGALQGQLGAANQLSGLGGQQLQAQQGIYNLQNQLGQQQQTQQQNVMNQAIQNYATEQQYPFMQLGVLNSMLRGLPMQQSSTQMYQAPPSAISQMAGLGTAGLGALGMYNQAMGNKSGGLMEVQKMAVGGSAIPMKSYSDDQLQGVLKSPASSLMADIYAQSLMKDRAYLKSNPMAANLISQQQMPQGLPPQAPQTPPMPSPDQMAMAPQNRVGLGSIGTGEMTQMAGGGLLAFVGGGNTSTDGSLYSDTPGPNTGGLDPMTASPEDLIRRRYIEGGKESDAAKAQREALQASIDERKKSMGYEGLTRFGLDMMAGQSPYALSNIGSAGKETLDYLSKQSSLNDADRKELLKLAVDTDKNRESREDQMLTSLNTVEANKVTKMYQLESLRIQRQAQADAKQITNETAASKLFSDTLSKNLLNARSNAARQFKEISEAEAYRQAYEETYNALKATPVFKLLKDLAEPEKAPAPVDQPLPPSEPSFFEKMFGAGKAAKPAGQVDPNNKFLH